MIRTHCRLAILAAVMPIGVLCVLTAPAAGGEARADENWRFFDQNDLDRLRKAAKTEWGQAIVRRMEQKVEERLAHDLTIPATPCGHYHHYFCPDHKRLLTFDFNRPRAHFCVECGTDRTGEAYDYAWYKLLHGHNQVFLRNCTMLYHLTGKGVYRKHIASMLLDYADKYPGYPIHGHDMRPDAPYGGRLFSQSLDETNWAIDVAPAYVAIRDRLKPREREHIEKNLFEPCAEVIFRHRTGGNWQVWHNGGLAVLAVALRSDHWMEIAIHAETHGYHAMMDTGVTAEGWWDERSPGYHFYPLHAMLHTAEAARCRGIDLYDERLKRMFTAPLNGVYANLAFPAHNDGWHGISLARQAPLYEIAALRYDDPALWQLLARSYSRERRESWTALLNGRTIRPDASPMPLGSVLYPDTGVAFLRSGARTVVLKYGDHGGGHGHPDKLSLALHDGAREILPDLGTPGYGIPDYTGWYRRTVAHNTVTVDGRDQAPAAGTLVVFEPALDGGVAEAKCETAYPDVTLIRRLELAGNRLRDRFYGAAEATRTFDYVLLLPERAFLSHTAAAPAMPSTDGYDRITDVRRHPFGLPLSMTARHFDLTIQSAYPVEVLQGQAPGIPANPWNKEERLGVCYPLILRTQGERMDITAEWTFKD